MKTKQLALIYACLGLSRAGKCPFGYDSEDKQDQDGTMRVLQERFQYPSELFTCTKETKALKTDTTAFTTDLYSQIALDVFELYNSSIAQPDFASCLVRLAGHDFMDFRQQADGTTTGGSDGCINFDDPDNSGLQLCLLATNIQSIYDKYCDVVSLADFIVIASEAVMARTATKFDANNAFTAGSLEDVFRQKFKAGRATSETCETVGMMPDAEKGCTDLKSIFIDHIYNDGKKKQSARWRLTAAITGAHTLGQARRENSGFRGSWSDSTNQGIFNNDFYKSLVLKGWAPQTIDESHHQWRRVDSSTEDPFAVQ